MAPWLIPALKVGIPAIASVASQLFANRSAKKNIEAQNEYNSPKNQMARFQEAGLNPNLIYSQGNPGNQAQAAPALDFSGSIEAFNQTRMVNAQVSAKNADTIKKQMDTQVASVQKRLLEANPLLNNEGFRATLQILTSTAALKSNEELLSGVQTSALMETQGKERKDPETGQPKFYTRAAEKVIQEVELLNQKFDLGQQDQKIKAEVLSSKQFQNAILEVQKRFMTDFELTPQNWLQFVTLLLQKAF